MTKLMRQQSHFKSKKMEKFNITSKNQYHKIMVDIYNLMNKGENKLTKTEITTLQLWTKEAERYEDEVLLLKPKPNNITEIIETKLFEKKMTQAKLAELINMDTPKVSQILNNKRKPDVKFLKAIHNKLGIDGNLLLELA